MKITFTLLLRRGRIQGTEAFSYKTLKGEGRMKSNKVFWVLFVGILFIGFTHDGFAQAYPTKPIRVVVPNTAGGSNDLLMRGLQRPLEKELGGKIVVENIPGGNYKVGTMEVVNAAPDGYTLLYAGHAPMIAYFYGGTYDFRVWEKLTIIAQTGETPLGLFEVRNDSPFKTWADLVSFAKKNPGKLTCGGAGARGQLELIVIEATKALGIQVKYVPFAGSGPSGIALLGGHVDFHASTAADALPRIRAGQTRGLAMPSYNRLPELPDIPTFKEVNLPLILPPYGYNFWGPLNLPQRFVDQISQAVEKAIKDKDNLDLGSRMLYQPIFKNAKTLNEEIKNFDATVGPKFAATFPKL
jgi:tripartite-type tricarboxylate transporter receptor subunit TctC